MARTSLLSSQTPARYLDRTISSAALNVSQGFGAGGIVPGMQLPAPDAVTSFTLLTTDFLSGYAIYQDTTPIGEAGNLGFTNDAAQNQLFQGYYGQSITVGAVNKITAAYTELGLDPNNSTGYVWNITWAGGSSISTGLVKFGFYAPSTYFDIQTIDPTDTDYLIPDTGQGTSLAGTFLFPATFTAYLPLLNKTGWC